VVEICGIFGVDSIGCAKILELCGCVWVSALWFCFVGKSCVVRREMDCDDGCVCVTKSRPFCEMLAHNGCDGMSDGVSFWVWVFV